MIVGYIGRSFDELVMFPDPVSRNNGVHIESILLVTPEAIVLSADNVDTGDLAFVAVGRFDALYTGSGAYRLGALRDIESLSVWPALPEGQSSE
jgi:hypothetical protein